jgi:pSer/pThr/pTyr-binding forkhead associated (FHA) protein
MTDWVLETVGEADPLTFRLRSGATRTIGRAPAADFILDRTLVSRVHCRVSANDEALQVEDLESTNGTFVNGARVTRAQAVDGDTLRLGRVELAISRHT